MSLFDYLKSKEIAALDVSFYAIVMAAMRQADTPNTEKLQAAWPVTYEEMRERYNAPGGVLNESEDDELAKY